MGLVSKHAAATVADLTVSMGLNAALTVGKVATRVQQTLATVLIALSNAAAMDDSIQQRDCSANIYPFEKDK